MKRLILALLVSACAPVGSSAPTLNPSVPATTASASSASSSAASTLPGTVTVDRCGIINDAFLSDPPSGGFVTISGVKYLVQSADPNRKVSLSNGLVPGASACARGIGIDVSPQVVDLRSGSVTVGP